GIVLVCIKHRLYSYLSSVLLKIINTLTSRLPPSKKIQNLFYTNSLLLKPLN
ncbi:hypothetical protein Tsubulata_024259, partial [Turnera subulata]